MIARVIVSLTCLQSMGNRQGLFVQKKLAAAPIDNLLLPQVFREYHRLRAARWARSALLANSDVS